MLSPAGNCRIVGKRGGNNKNCIKVGLTQNQPSLCAMGDNLYS